MALTQLPISQSSSFTEFVTCLWLSDLKIHRLKDRGSHGLYDCGGDSLVPRLTPFFTLQFALTIVHGSGSAVKNGEGLGAFKTMTLFFPPSLLPLTLPPRLTASRMKGELSHGSLLTSLSHTQGRTGCSTSSSTAGSLCILS